MSAGSRRRARSAIRSVFGAAVCAAVAVLPPAPGHGQAVPPVEGVAVEEAPVALDRVLVDAGRARRRFRGDVVGPGPVIVSFTYSACGTVCPVSDLVMGAVEDALARDGRRDVALATLTLDPLTDTPERLRAHAATLGAGPLRRFYTGAPADVYAVLDALGMRFGRFEDHAAFFVVFGADGRAGRRLPAGTGPEVLLHAAGAGR